MTASAIILDDEDVELGFYFEYSNKNIEYIKIDKNESIDERAEQLLEKYSNGAYCSFECNKLDEKSFEILKNLGISAYIGIMDRYGDKKALDDFNVTDDEMVAFNMLQK